MIKQPAKVIAETSSAYLLETLPKSACPQCEAGQGCGGGILVKAFANKTFQISINKKKPLLIGELVQLGIPSSILIRASFLLYLMPLVFMVTGALLFGMIGENHDAYTVTGAILGIVLGAYLGRILSGHYFKGGITTAILIDDDIDNCWFKTI